MAIIRERKDHTVNLQCDDCSNIFEGDPHESFADMFERAKAEGWAAVKQGDAWSHMCKDCAS
jgi:hypothetical protein